MPSASTRSLDRRGWFLAFAVLLSLMVMVSVALGAQADDLEPRPANAAPAPTPAELAPIEQEEREHEEWLESPQAEQEREESERAYNDLSSGEARDLLSEAFAETLDGLDGDPGRILGTLDVEKMLGTSSALVKGPDGGSAILNSSTPLQSDLGGEGTEPVDLSLKQSGQGFAPANPLEEVELPGSAAEPIRLEGGINVGLPATADQSAVRLGEMNLFYAETETATDTLVAPRATGVEVFEQLRSPESPEELRFDLSLPEGMKLQRSAHGGGAEVVSADGDVVAEVTPPTASDAQGAVVPVTMDVDGNSLVLDVPHRDADLAYPILVDPNFVNNTTNFSEWLLGPGNYGGYYMQSIPGSLDAFSWGGTEYPAWSSANWVYTAVNQTTYIAAATFSPIYFLANGCNTENPHGYVGIYNTATQSFENHFGNYWFGDSSNATWESGWVGGYNTRQAMIGIGTYGGVQITCNHELYVGGYSIQESDPYAPSIGPISGIPAAGSWFDPSTAGSASIGVADNGLGVQEITIADGGGTSVRNLGCSGASGSRCPTSTTWSVAPPYVEGEKTLTISTHDPVANYSSWTRATKVDGTAPTTSVTNTLTATTLNAKVESSDGVSGNPRSGVKEVKVYVDKVLKETRTNTCATSGCPFTLNFTYSQELKGLSAGTHTVEAVAFDQLNHQRTASAAFTIEAPDTVIDSGPEGLTKTATPTFTYHSTLTGSTFQCRIDTGAWVSCPATGYTTAKLAEGPHTFEVKAISGAGLEDPTPARREFNVLGPPDTTIVFGPKGLTNVKRPTFGYQSSNPQAWFECKVDSGAYEPCGPATYESLEGQPGKVLADGAHSVSVRAVNQLEDADPTPAVASFTVDTAAPKAEITSGPEGATNETRPTFNFTASGGTVTCFLETKGEPETEEAEPPFAACTTSSSYTPASPLAEGSYVLHLRARDATLNETEDVRPFSVDTAAPETTITSAPAAITDNATPTIEFASSEVGSSFQCRYDAEAFRACSGPGATDTRAATLADGAHTFQVRAVDGAANADATPATATFTLVTNGPQTSINSSPEGAIAATEAAFTYSTDETASMECKLDGASFASCPTTGKTYTGLTEGEHVFEVRGKNKAGVADPTPARRAFVVDTSAPSTPVLSGPIFEAAGYGLHFQVAASDGSPSTPSSRRSGVESVQILLAGEVVMELGAECAAKTCQASFMRDAQIPWQPLLAAPAGAIVQARAKDGLGHVSTSSLEIKQPHEQAVQLADGSGGGAFALQAAGCHGPAKPEPKGARLIGTCGKDTLTPGPGIEVVEGLAGDDVIIGGPNTKVIKGGEGNDILRGGGGNDRIEGGGGADHIYGGNGDDKLFGGDDNDVLDGGPGTDIDKGQKDNDTLRDGQGPKNKLFGGPGSNTVSFADVLPPGFAEMEIDETSAMPVRPNLYTQAKNKALANNIHDFPPAAESGVYIHFASGNSGPVAADSGIPAEGGGTATLKEIQHIVGSPFADWIEGAVANTIDTGPGQDMVFNAGSGLAEDKADWVNGVREKYTPPTRPTAGTYKAGAETNVYVIGGAAASETFTAKLSGNQVRITGAVTKAFPVGEGLGALVLYGGGEKDKVNVTNENKERPGAIELDGGPGSDELVGGSMDELLVDGIQQYTGTQSSTGVERLFGAGGEDDLGQGEGADKVEGGTGNDLFLNSRVCEKDSFYAFTSSFNASANKKEAEEAEDNAQFHLLADQGVYANMKKEELGGVGNNLEAMYELNCGPGVKAGAFKDFNAFEGSPQNDLVRGNRYHNYILGRGGENRLYGGPGNDVIVANNNHPELVINCGGQTGDKAFVDRERDYKYSPPYKEMNETCKTIKKEPPVYDDGQTELLTNPSRPLHPVNGGGRAAAASTVVSSGTAAQASTLAALASAQGESGAYPTAEFHFDETTGTSAANALDEEAPATYMAKGVGPSVGGPGPVLGGESALFDGEEEPEEERASISLDGKTAYVNLNGQAGPEGGEEGYSVSLYVKFAAAPGKREYLFSSAGTGGRGAFLYRAPSGSIVFTTGQLFGAPAVVSEPIAAGGWHQVVASMKGQTISLNIDGFPYELGYGSNVTPAPELAPESLLGAGPGATELLAGSVDEFTSYEGVPSEGEIFAMLAGSRAQIAEYLPATPAEGDEDGDGVADGLDNCPANSNPDQADSNLDGVGDACQMADQDEDGLADASDNCPTIYNPEQIDTNKDGVGDDCSNLSPEVETGGAAAVKATTATIEGTVNPEGSATSYYFEYGPTTSYGNKIPASPKAVGTGFATVAVSQALTGLTQGTAYHYRLVATNAAGTETGFDQTFLTLKAPKATTGSVTGIGQKSATVNGTVNPEGSATSYYFEYGPTTSYGTKIPASPKEVGAGTSEVAVSQSLTGLTSGTTYHYRLVAASVAATTNGVDRTFATEASSPVASELAAMALTDPFNATNNAVSNFSTKWSVLGWAAGKGEDRTNGWGASSAYPVINGAYFSPNVADVGTGVADIVTVASGPGNNFPSRYFSLWLDLQTPSSTRSGYQLRFVQTSLNVYEVILAKWSAGTETVLATKTGYSLAAGSSVALVDEGSSVAAWTNTGSGFTQILAAADGSFSGGNGGVEASGNESRLTNFKIGQLLPAAANMSAALGALRLDDAFATTETPLSGGGAWAALSWDYASANRTGRVVAGEGWGPVDPWESGEAINGAYWTKATFADTGAGDAVAATLKVRPGLAARHFELLLNMPNPASARSGYELRFTEPSAGTGTYTVTLVKWVSGTATTLASQANVSLAIGGRFGLADKAGVLSVWTAGATGEFTQLLSASDTTYQSGYLGIAGGGNFERLASFRGAQLPPF
jgi:Ca2+-binding RTX toxin-like protein